jgi:RNA polymerase primary sigma factor
MKTLLTKYGQKSHGATNTPNEVRAESLLQTPADYMYNADFDDAAKEKEFLAPMPGEVEFQAAREKMRAPKDVPTELISLYEWPLLNREQEAHLFRAMNMLKHKLHKLRQTINPNSPRVKEMQQVESLRGKIQEVKSRLINCNMRLVASIAKKHSNQMDNIFELISDGNISLLRAVEKFDYSRGNKFSTYASWAIMKNYARSIPDEKKVREHYLTGTEEIFNAKADVRSDEQELVAQAEVAKDKVGQLLDGLDPRTREVIRMRNGLDGSAEMTLEQIGKHFGITKERVRQINLRGMKQLRERALSCSIEMAN